MAIWRTTGWGTVVVLALTAAGCGSGEGLPAMQGREGVDTVDSDGSADSPGIEIRETVSLGTLNPLLLGTNVPAWLGSERLDGPYLRSAIETSGATLLRLPGGSWSNHYSWWDCERDTAGCAWPWAMAPTDFARLISDTGLPTMWTVSFNGTAQEAAALVAFFNGEVGDDHEIGVDRNGVDWGSVDRWAQERFDAGFNDPVRIDYWEVGNEIYGAVPEAGPQCAEWGWENVSTCDGTEYVLGTDGQDGYLAFAEAMRAVDSTIVLGAVGTVYPEDYGEFGLDALHAGVDEFDFYIVHHYGFGGTPDIDEVLDRPDDVWHTVVDRVGVVAAAAGGETPAIAATEYNMAAWLDGDVDALMSSVANLFYMTETIGEMATGGVQMATQWNLMNGAAESGADYGIVHADTGQIYPQFFSLRLWSTMATELVAVRLSLDAFHLDVWAAVAPDGYDVLVLNPFEDALSVPLLAPTESALSLSIDQVIAASFDATEVGFNGVAVTVPSELPTQALDLGLFANGDEVEIPAWSATVFHLRFAD